MIGNTKPSGKGRLGGEQKKYSGSQQQAEAENQLVGRRESRKINRIWRAGAKGRWTTVQVISGDKK